ncbi:MAG: hypothetical protein RLZZ522_266 [Verrucomicrobiota bacterium]
MNTLNRYLILLLGGLGLTAGFCNAQTLNWGSPMFSDLVDSKGDVLDDTFVFELGAFVNSFTPDATNTAAWLDNWQTFDAADYNGVETPVDDGIYGYFTAASAMNSSGTGPASAPGAISFEGLDAYIWVRNSNTPGVGTEWSLSRAGGWQFPSVDPDCCGGDLPLEWSLSDLTPSYVPVWGTQNGVKGGGEITDTGTYTLQTATFVPIVVPEPSSSILALLGVIIALIHRRR